MPGMVLSQPMHLQLGGPDGASTACGQRSIQHRPLRYTNDASRVSCRPCRRWLTKKQKEEARIAQPKPVN